MTTIKFPNRRVYNQPKSKDKGYHLTMQFFSSNKVFNSTKNKQKNNQNQLFNLAELGQKSPFVFQVLSIVILTLAMILYFQNFISNTVLDTSAQTDNSSQEIRLLTNFQKKQSHSNSHYVNILEEYDLKPTMIKSDSNATQEKSVNKIYLVKPMDTLESIAKKLGVNINILIEKNKLDKPYTLQVDQQLEF
jgi:LysM repeat protein